MAKILLIPEFDTFGGTRTFFKTILEFYAAQKFDVTIVLSKKQLDAEIMALIEVHNFKYVLIPERETCLKRLWFRFPFSLFFDIKTIYSIYHREKPDLIVVSNGTPPFFLGLAYLPVRFLYIMHTYPTPGGKLVWLKKIFYSLALTGRKKILTFSSFSKLRILDCLFLRNIEKKISIVRHSADSLPACAVSSISRESNTRRILTLGHVTWYKNPVTWVQVAQRVIDKLPSMPIEFIWAGDGDLLGSCKEMIDESHRNAIRFIGYQRDIDTLYKTSSVYFQPSLIENASLSVIDAMRRGIPCVVSNTGGLPELVIDNVSGFIEQAEDVDSMSEKIIALLTSPDLYQRIGEAARLYYQETFSYAVWNSKMIALHESLLLQ